MQRFTVITATPKKRAVTLVALGCCATLSLPPFFILPLLLLSFSGWLALLMRAETPAQAFRTGWWWGLGFFVSGLYWTSISLLVDAERFAWMIPLALFGINGLIALFSALASLAFFYLYSSSRLRGANVVIASLIFTLCFSLSEFLRSTILTGFPWNLVGYAWGEWESAMQVASIIGIHGLTLATILLSLTPLLFKRGEKTIATRIIFVWMLAIAWGMWRVDNAPTQPSADQPTVRVVQAAIPQSLKWIPEERVKGIHKHINLTREAKGNADIIVWPESAVPIAINKEPVLENDLRALLTDSQLLITGSIRVGKSLDPKQPAIYNSVYALNHQGISHIYDKHHLVPFGEFVPLRSVLPLDKISPGAFDYSRGTGPQTVTPMQGALPYSPLVCYEAIFPNEAVAAHQPRPAYMVNVTNDAWFGHSTGPYQHLHMVRFRAVEQGIPLVRAANTGISAVIDSVGRVVDSIPLGQSGTIDVQLPDTLAPTPYSKIGNWSYALIFIALVGLTVGCILHRRLQS